MGKAKIKRVKHEEYSASWHEQRSKTLGGSSIGAVMGHSSFSTPLKVFLEMIREPLTPFNGNTLTRTGSFMEEHIAHLFKHWDHENPTYDDCLKNLEKGKRFNRIRRDKCTFVNPKYPFHANVDGFVQRDPKGKGIIEIKNTTKMVTRTYKDGISPAYYLQMQHYMLVLEDVKFCYFITFLDGNDMEVKTVYPDRETQDAIIEHGTAFMERVKIAKEIKQAVGLESYYNAKLDDLSKDQLQAVEMLQQLEPEMQPADLDVVKDLVKPTEEYTHIEGSQSLRERALSYLDISEQIKDKSATKKLLQAEMIKELGGRHEAIFDEGKIAYRPDSRGRNNFYVSPKLKQA